MHLTQEFRIPQCFGTGFKRLYLIRWRLLIIRLLHEKSRRVTWTAHALE
jgi:hypothetical protein